MGGTGVFEPGSGGLVTKYDSSAIVEGLREIRIVGGTGVFDPGSIGAEYESSIAEEGLRGINGEDVCGICEVNDWSENEIGGGVSGMFGVIIKGLSVNGVKVILLSVLFSISV